MQKKRSFLLIALLLCATGFAANCDTLFVSRQADVRYDASLDSLKYDSAVCVQKFAAPAGYFYQGALGNETGAYRLAFRKGKKWMSWATGIDDIEFGRFYFGWQQVDGKGGPELLIWICHDFGHHAATHATEHRAYSLQVWEIEHGRLLLWQEYRAFEWWVDMDMGGATDSAGNPWPPAVDEQLGVALYTGKLFLTDSSRVKMTVFPSQAAADTTKEKPDYYRVAPCADEAGIYRFTRGAWVRTSDAKLPKGPAAHPPGHHAYWEWF